jgi:hypothetical protein
MHLLQLALQFSLCAKKLQRGDLGFSSELTNHVQSTIVNMNLARPCEFEPRDYLNS